SCRIDSACGLTLRATLRVVVSLRDARTSTVLHPTRPGELCRREMKSESDGAETKKAPKGAFL
ncbi:hypothetical protein, partial [uncultured Serratia sp.]|uniref:hypothetical protein n=1 Tax=uncultured Serratia sp. TaxID=239175 RepID=UPI002805C41B